jgi:hypothetical protein
MVFYFGFLYFFLSASKSQENGPPMQEIN